MTTKAMRLKAKSRLRVLKHGIRSNTSIICPRCFMREGHEFKTTVADVNESKHSSGPTPETDKAGWPGPDEKELKAIKKEGGKKGSEARSNFNTVEMDTLCICKDEVAHFRAFSTYSIVGGRM